MQFVDIAQRFKAGVTVHCDDRAADGRSPMEMLMLVATQGARVRVVADGADAEQLVEALTRLVESGFGES
jgi:phosphocarrier protein